MTTLRAVFWDVDGTLADTEMDGHRPAFNKAFADLGLAWHWDPELYSRLLAIPGGLRRVEAYAKEMKILLTAEQLDRLRVQKRLHYLERIRQGCVGWRPGVKRLLFELDDAGLQRGLSRQVARHRFVPCSSTTRPFPRSLEWSQRTMSALASRIQRAIDWPCAAAVSTLVRLLLLRIPRLVLLPPRQLACVVY